MLHQISKPQYNRPMVNAKTEDLPHRLVRQHRSNASEETYYIQLPKGKLIYLQK